MDEIRKYTMKEFSEFTESELIKISDLQLLILKGHILIEYALNCYLESITKTKDSNFFKEKFSFYNKIKIAQHFGELGSQNENLIEELHLINKIRNEIAHSLSFNEKLLDRLFNEISKKVPDGIYADPKAPIQMTLIGGISFLTGAIFAGYKFHTDLKDLESFADDK